WPGSNAQGFHVGDLLMLVHPVQLEGCWLLIEISQALPDRTEGLVLASAGGDPAWQWYAYVGPDDGAEAVRRAAANDWKNLLRNPAFVWGSKDDHLVEVAGKDDESRKWSIALMDGWILGGISQGSKNCRIGIKRRPIEEAANQIENCPC